jgi:proteasome accessory factor C
VFTTEFAGTRQLIAWVLGLGEHARLLEPRELVEEASERLATLVDRHFSFNFVAEPATKRRRSDSAGAEDGDGAGPDRESQIRPERFARLVALAGILIQAARKRERISVSDVCERLNLILEELTEDINLLNVVNFGGGSYVLYAEVQGDEIEIDTEPYSDNFARPARLLPLEAKALVAAIDLLGDHLPEGSLGSAREKIVAALGDDPAHEGLQIAPTTYDDPELTRTINAAIADSRLLALDYYKENEDEFTKRKVEPYALINGREGWYLFSFDTERDDTRHFRLDRIKRAKMLDEKFAPRDLDPTADLEGWPRTGTLPASRVARVWISPERARWERERRRVVEELADDAVVVELPFAGTRWLVREILKEAGDAVVLEPEDARADVLAAAKNLSESAATRRRSTAKAPSGEREARRRPRKARAAA